MDSKSNQEQGHISDKTNEVNLIGFDNLWDVGSEDAYKFIKFKQTVNEPKEQAEIEFLSKELDDRNFEVQKLNWQLTEREKELKNLYDELHKLIELNKKLNGQLVDFEKLTAKQEALIEMLSRDPNAHIEPVLPNFGERSRN